MSESSSKRPDPMAPDRTISFVFGAVFGAVAGGAGGMMTGNGSWAVMAGWAGGSALLAGGLAAWQGERFWTTFARWF